MSRSEESGPGVRAWLGDVRANNAGTSIYSFIGRNGHPMGLCGRIGVVCFTGQVNVLCIALWVMIHAYNWFVSSTSRLKRTTGKLSI